MVNIREADFEHDALAIMEGAKDFARRVAFGDLLPSDDESFTAALSRIMALDGMQVLLAEHEGRVVAGLGLLYAPYLWNPALTVAEELFWWAAKDAPFRAATALISEAMTIVRERNAIPAFRALMTSPDGVDRLYRRIGLAPIETVYMGGRV